MGFSAKNNFLPGWKAKKNRKSYNQRRSGYGSKSWWLSRSHRWSCHFCRKPCHSLGYPMTRPMARCHLKMSSSSTSPTWTKNCQPHLKTWNSSTNPGTYCDIIICNTYHLNMFYNMFCSLYLYLYLCLCLCLSIYIYIYTLYTLFIYIYISCIV